jgi:hypothetical protein
MTDHGKEKTPPTGQKFDFTAYPDDTLFHDRREGRDRRQRGVPGDNLKASSPDRPPAERRAKKERRRRIDPTTFEKQYTDEEIEFMNAMQRFKLQSGRSFPTYGEVLKVAYGLGYRKVLAHAPTAALDGPSLLSASKRRSRPKPG